MASYVAYKPTGEVIGIMGKGTLKMSIVLLNGLQMNAMNSPGSPKEKVLQRESK